MSPVARPWVVPRSSARSSLADPWYCGWRWFWAQLSRAVLTYTSYLGNKWTSETSYTTSQHHTNLILPGCCKECWEVCLLLDSCTGHTNIKTPLWMRQGLKGCTSAEVMSPLMSLSTTGWKHLGREDDDTLSQVSDTDESALFGCLRSMDTELWRPQYQYGVFILFCCGLKALDFAKLSKEARNFSGGRWLAVILECI